jgi:hypothetical protein
MGLGWLGLGLGTRRRHLLQSRTVGWDLGRWVSPAGLLVPSAAALLSGLSGVWRELGISSPALQATLPDPSSKLSSAKLSSASERNSGVSPTRKHQAPQCRQSSSCKRKPTKHQAGSAWDRYQTTWRRKSTEYSSRTTAGRTAASQTLKEAETCSAIELSRWLVQLGLHGTANSGRAWTEWNIREVGQAYDPAAILPDSTGGVSREKVFRVRRRQVRIHPPHRHSSQTA